MLQIERIDDATYLQIERKKFYAIRIEIKSTSKKKMKRKRKCEIIWERIAFNQW